MVMAGENAEAGGSSDYLHYLLVIFHVPSLHSQSFCQWTDIDSLLKLIWRGGGG